MTVLTSLVLAASQDELLSEQERIARLVNSLDATLTRLIERLADKEDVARLKAAQARLKEAAFENRFEHLKKLLEGRNLGEAQGEADVILARVQEILALLENKKPDPEEAARRLKEQIERLRQIIELEKGIDRQLEEINREDKEFEAIIELIERIQKEQEEILRDTERMSQSARIDQLIDLQREAMNEAAKNRTQELSTMAGLLREAEELLREQQELREKTAAAAALSLELEKIIEEQKAKPKDQGAVNDRLWKLGNRLFNGEFAGKDKALKELEKAFDEMELAARGSPADLDGAVRGLERALAQLRDPNLAERQKEIEKRTADLQTRTRHKSVAQPLSDARQNQRESESRLRGGRNAEQPQKRAEEGLKTARDRLKSLAQALGQRDQAAAARSAAAQERAASEGAKLADRLAPTPAGSPLRAAHESMEQASRNLRNGSPEADGNQRDALAQLLKSKAALQSRPGLDHAQADLAKSLEERVTRWLEKKAEAERAREHARAAQQHMGSSQEKLRQGNPSESMTDQSNAIDRLNLAKEDLKRIAKRPATPPDRKRVQDLEPEQDRVEQLTRELQKKVDGAGRNSAAQNLSRAAQSMRAARKHMMEGAPPESEEEVDRAQDDLGRALHLLLDELDRVAPEEVWTHLAEALARILEAERTIRRGTGELDAARARDGILDRAQALRAGRLAAEQSTLQKRMEEILKALTMENVDVYEFVEEQIIDEMAEAAAALRDRETGALVQDLQDSIVRRLSDLIEAWRTPKANPRKPGKITVCPGPPKLPGTPPPDDRRPPLVPDVVQLNLMRKLQESILQKTGALKGREPNEAQRKLLNRLSEEQRRLGEAMDRFIRKFGQMMEVPPARDQGISFQDDPPQGEPDEGESSPEETLKLVHRLMRLSEEDLQAGSRAVREIEKLLSRSERSQLDVIGKLKQLLRQSRAPSAPSPDRAESKPGTSQPSGRRPSSAPIPYPPERSRPPSSFQWRASPGGEWGVLGPKERQAILHEIDRLQDFAPEYQDQVRAFFEALMMNFCPSEKHHQESGARGRKP
jgi:hypothetical protein